MDPSIATPVTNATVVADPRDTHLPLGGVCETQVRWLPICLPLYLSLSLSIYLSTSLYIYLSPPLHLSTDLPLQARWVRGAMVFTLICTGCLGFVIFATGKAEPLEPLRPQHQTQTQTQTQT